MEQLLTLGEAASYIGVSLKTMTGLVRDGTVKANKDPIDKRKKLVKKSEIDRLKEGSHGNNN